MASPSMAALRRVILRLHQGQVFNQLQSPKAPIQSSRLGSICRLSSPSGGGSIDIDLSDEESKRRLHNRLLYRSKQRGFLELDLVLGNWVEQHIRNMNELHIRFLMDVLDQENPDLWKWLTCQEHPPDLMKINPVFTAVQSKVIANLNAHSSPETRASPGQPWVRGWDDKDDKRGLDGPKHGNQ